MIEDKLLESKNRLKRILLRANTNNFLGKDDPIYSYLNRDEAIGAKEIDDVLGFEIINHEEARSSSNTTVKLCIFCARKNEKANVKCKYCQKYLNGIEIINDLHKEIAAQDIAPREIPPKPVPVLPNITDEILLDWIMNARAGKKEDVWPFQVSSEIETPDLNKSIPFTFMAQYVYVMLYLINSGTTRANEIRDIFNINETKNPSTCLICKRTYTSLSGIYPKGLKPDKYKKLSKLHLNESIGCPYNAHIGCLQILFSVISQPSSQLKIMCPCKKPIKYAKFENHKKLDDFSKSYDYAKMISLKINKLMQRYY
jgi:hypothetical protein